jgi:hypothetical protein
MAGGHGGSSGGIFCGGRQPISKPSGKGTHRKGKYFTYIFDKVIIIRIPMFGKYVEE